MTWSKRWVSRGISKSEVSRMAGELDVKVAEFRQRPLDAGPYRYLWIDALMSVSCGFVRG